MNAATPQPVQLETLALKGFRNLCEGQFSPGSGLNVIWGDNAQGKTSLLEAVYLLGHGKSFRSSRATDMINYDAEKAVISGQSRTQQVCHLLRWEAGHSTRSFELDGKTPSGLAELGEVLPQVLFAPEEVLPVKGPPATRRALLDRAIFQLEPVKIRVIQQFRRHLAQRNLLLRSHASRVEIAVWSQLLAESACAVRQLRRNFLAQLQTGFAEAFSLLTQGRERAEIRYPEGDAGEQQRFLAELERLEEQERKVGTTLVGPQRDDPAFLLNGCELRRYGSQGQHRTFILAFKVALVGCLRRVRGVTPLLLLDDITSELDASRRRALFELLRNDLGQTFVTTTDPDLLKGSGLGEPRLFRITHGTITAA